MTAARRPSAVPIPLVLALLAAALALAAAAGPARASDEKAFQDLKARYEKLARNHDDPSNRERRRLVLQMFDYLDQKACRKLLRAAYEDEDQPDNRTVVVQVLAAGGDPKDLDFLVGCFKKEKARGPVIALGEGLGFTAAGLAAPVAEHAAGLLAKARGDLRLALLEGLGALGQPGAYAALAAAGEKLTREERFERNVALGACGKAQSIDALAREGKDVNADVRLGAALGLAAAKCPAALGPLTEMLSDFDPRVVEVAAVGLGEAKHEPAVPRLVDALTAAPLRVRAALRAALAAITGKDYGFDAAAWRAALEAAKSGGSAPAPPPAPKLPEFFGIPVASDRVVLLLDTSHSMDWLGRLARAQEGLSTYLASLPEDAAFDVQTVEKVPERFGDRLAAGTASRARAQEWIRAQMSSTGFDLKESLLTLLRDRPDADTVVLATDSYPWGETAADTPLEVMEIFRQANRVRRVRVHVAFVVPGGRHPTGEPYEDEFEDRAALLKQLAETSGGTFVRVEK